MTFTLTPSLNVQFTTYTKLIPKYCIFVKIQRLGKYVYSLVKMSTVWSFVRQHCISIDPSFTSCLMKWQCILTCLVCSWKTRFLASLSTPWLSQNRAVVFVCCIFMFKSISLIQTTSHSLFTSPWYSASVDERATICCFSLVHVTAHQGWKHT